MKIRKPLFFAAVLLLILGTRLFATPTSVRADVVKRANGWWYVNSAGKIDRRFTGFAKNKNGWWYCERGRVTFKKNGVIRGRAKGKTAWWNVKKSKIKAGPTVEQNKNGWWYIDKNGKVDFSYNGFAKNKNGWWYCEKGRVHFKKNDVIWGRAKGKNAWWNVKKSKIKAGPTVEQNKNGWWYIDKNGKVDFSYNGFAKNQNGWWYAEKGKVTFKKNDLIRGTIDGQNTRWYVKKSKVIEPASFDDTGVEWIAHRGLSAIAPENTRAAFELAAAEDFDGIECDVQMTADGIFVISHDDDLSRIFGKKQLISRSRYDEIKDLVAVGGNGIDQYPNEHLLTLDEYLEILSASDKRAVIELKQVWSQDACNQLYDQIASFGINDRVEIISFKGDALLRMTKSAQSYSARHIGNEDDEIEIYPDIPAMPYMSLVTRTPDDAISSSGGQTALTWAIQNDYGLCVHQASTTPKIAKTLHAAGERLTVWTVDHPDKAYYCARELDADAVTTNLCVWKQA